MHVGEHRVEPVERCVDGLDERGTVDGGEVVHRRVDRVRHAVGRRGEGFQRGEVESAAGARQAGQVDVCGGLDEVCAQVVRDAGRGADGRQVRPDHGHGLRCGPQRPAGRVDGFGRQPPELGGALVRRVGVSRLDRGREGAGERKGSLECGLGCPSVGVDRPPAPGYGRADDQQRSDDRERDGPRASAVASHGAATCDGAAARVFGFWHRRSLGHPT